MTVTTPFKHMDSFYAEIFDFSDPSTGITGNNVVRTATKSQIMSLMWNAERINFSYEISFQFDTGSGIGDITEQVYVDAVDGGLIPVNRRNFGQRNLVPAFDDQQTPNFVAGKYINIFSEGSGGSKTYGFEANIIYTEEGSPVVHAITSDNTIPPGWTGTLVHQITVNTMIPGNTLNVTIWRKTGALPVFNFGGIGPTVFEVFNYTYPP